MQFIRDSPSSHALNW